ncbi:M20/M25/M40 family metallo-hydrolase [Halocola ammonii]
MDMQLLEELCAVHATSGDESAMTEFILQHVKKEQKNWKEQPQVFSGDEFQDAVVLVFGKPRTAVFAHLDSIGYCASYSNTLVKIGGPKAKTGTSLVGRDSHGPVECTLEVKKEDKKDKDGEKQSGKEEKYYYKFHRDIDRGTPLSYKPEWREEDDFVQCCYIDNRLGVWNALQQCKTAENAAIVFSTYEEHGGGSAQFLGRFLQEKFGVRQALISDISLISDGIKHKNGVAISMRDRGIPRQSYVRRIVELARAHDIPHQLEVESAGGSDGNAIQGSSYPWDWCFVGAAEANYHTPNEKVYKSDIKAMVDLYEVLLKEL